MSCHHSWVTAFGQCSPDAGFAFWLFWKLPCLRFALTLMHIRQQNAWVLLSQLNRMFGCSYLVSSWPTWGTCACSGKGANNFFFPITSIFFLSQFKRNLNLSPSKFCDACQSLLQVLYIVSLTVTLGSSPKGASLMTTASTNVKCETVAFTYEEQCIISCVTHFKKF